MVDKPQKQVLLVEDQEGIAVAVDRVVRGEGYHCARVRGAGSAMDVVASDRPDLVLIDSAKDGLSAHALCQSIRQEPRSRNIKIMVLNESGRTIDRRRCEALGADGFLAKPFELSDLRDEMRRLLGDTRLQ